jgi:hypothetical protein
MASFANEYATILKHHSGVKEREVAIKMTDFSLTTRMRSIDHFNNILSLYGVLFGIQRYGLAILLTTL